MASASATPDLAAMLNALTDSGPSADSPRRARQEQQRLVDARLGVASGLFAAMRAKHEATAMHCLRVALGCSAWSLLRDMNPEERDALEIAALLHDVGKIGVPDAVLLKPSKLNLDEAGQMEQHKVVGQQILAACCSSADLLEVIHYAAMWYDGSTENDLIGKDLPLGARMLAIVDAYDSMTTDHVYRRAMPRERAVAELYEGARRQFDPDLVAEFCNITDTDRMRLDESVSSRWLHELKPANTIWAQGPQLGGSQQFHDLGLFHERLFYSMQDAVVFIDRHGRIESWNHAAERLSGIAASAVVGQQWHPELVELEDDDGVELDYDSCPISLVLKSGVQGVRTRLDVGPTGKSPRHQPPGDARLG